MDKRQIEQALGKGLAEGAYEGCVMSGEKALEIVQTALETLRGAK